MVAAIPSLFGILVHNDLTFIVTKTELTGTEKLFTLLFKWFVTFIFERIDFIMGCIYYNNNKRNSFNYSKRSYWWSWDRYSEKKQKKPQKTLLSFPSLPTNTKKTTKKPIPTFWQCRPPKYAFCQCEATQYPQNFLLKILSATNHKFATHRVIQISLFNWGNIHFKPDICNSPYQRI